MDDTSVALPKRSDFGSENSRINSTPILSLVPDVLCEIFEFECSTSGSLAITVDGISAPTLVLSQVCRSWRSLILSHSSLWSSLTWSREDQDLDADAGFFSPAAAKRPVQLWDLYLSRSRKALLDISLHLYEDDDPETCKHLLDGVFEHQHRLTNLELYCREKTIPYEKKYTINDAPNLKTLKLQVSACQNRPPEPHSRSFTIDPSRLGVLRELTVEGDVLLKQMDIANSLQSVAYLPENSFAVDTSVAFPSSTSGFLSLLHCVPCIREMKFDIDITTIPRLSPQRFPAHNLSKLCLYMKMEGNKVLDYLLGNLDIPVLEKLELLFYGPPNGDRRWRWNNGVALKSVKELVLVSNRPGERGGEMDPIHDENLRSLLLCTPALNSLDICAEWVSSQTLSLLTQAPSPSENAVGKLCPMLKKLSLTNFWCSVSRQEVADLISSRFLRTEDDVEGPRLSGLKDVFIRLGGQEGNGVDGPKLEDIEPIRSFIEQGLQLNAAYCHFQP